MHPNAKDCMIISLVLSMILGGFAWADESELFWSTFLGGNDNDAGRAICSDNSGYVFITGETLSESFPVTCGSFDTFYNNGEYDAFVVKLSPMGNALVFSTFLGGSDLDTGGELAVDMSGNIYVTGRTMSSDFPTTPGAPDTMFDGFSDAFAIKLSTAGDALEYSTFLGGGEREHGFGIAVDKSGCAHICGRTNSTDFQTTSGAFDSIYNGGAYDAFMVKISPAGNAFSYSTFIGGSEYDDIWDIALDSLGSTYLTGHTWSLDFPTTLGAFDTTYNGNYDAYAAKMNQIGSKLEYCTYLGGSEDDRGYAVTIDAARNIYVAGKTLSEDFPTTSDAYDSTYNGGAYDGFVAKLDPLGSSLTLATFLGGTYSDIIWGIGLDNEDNPLISGETDSPDFPVTIGAFDTTHNGGIDAFIAKLSAAGNTLCYSTLLGGSGNDRSLDMAEHGLGIVCITGYTESANFPVVAGYDSTYNGYTDAFVVKLYPGGDSTPPEAIDKLVAILDSGLKSYGGNIHLSWSEPFDSLGIHHYVIYRSESHQGFGDSLATTSDTTYLDEYVYAIGKPNLHYFYSVRAVDFAGNKSQHSNQAGEFDKVLRW